MCTVTTMAFIGQSKNVHIIAGMFTLDNLYLGYHAKKNVIKNVTPYR